MPKDARSRDDQPINSQETLEFDLTVCVLMNESLKNFGHKICHPEKTIRGWKGIQGLESLNINRREKQLIEGQLEEMDGAPKKKGESLVSWSPEEVYGEGWGINPVGKVPIVQT